MNRKLQTAKYLLFDWLSAVGAWSLFFFYRKIFIESQKFGHKVMVSMDDRFALGLLLIPLSWVIFYIVLGTYKHIYRKSRLKELFQTLLATLIGVLVLFFALILDDEILDHTTYYRSFTVLFGLHFSLTFAFRFMLTSFTARKLHHRQIGFPSLMVGSNEKAVELYTELESQRLSSGNIFVGFVSVMKRSTYPLKEHMPHLGDLNDLKQTVTDHNIEEVIVALESSEHESLDGILNRLEGLDLVVKVIPDMYDIITGSVKMDAIYGTPLIEVTQDLMPPWQSGVKRGFDIVLSIVAMTAALPIYLLTVIAVKFSSPGTAFFAQERIGKGGKPFYIYKFRSMFMDAESKGPALSSDHDPRITPFGRFMRKVRLDEMPQFYNVLKGDMSLVGPRPERQFFIDQIVEQAPHYRHLHRVKPGLTSWGMVKYGYAENVDQMVRRMKYDLIYIENMSLLVDLKILIYTVQTVLMGRGK